MPEKQGVRSDPDGDRQGMLEQPQYTQWPRVARVWNDNRREEERDPQRLTRVLHQVTVLTPMHRPCARDEHEQSERHCGASPVPRQRQPTAGDLDVKDGDSHPEAEEIGLS